jgi:hypothetical protein
VSEHTQSNWKWIAQKRNEFPSYIDEIPQEDDMPDTIWVTRVLGKGTYGKVCEAIYKIRDGKWNRCAVKFEVGGDAWSKDVDDMSDKCCAWNDVYSKRNGGLPVAFLKTFNNCSVLVMPYVEIIHGVNVFDSFPSKVDDCVKLIAEAKIKHIDLECRHVGLRKSKGTGEEEIWIIDFGMIERIETDGETELDTFEKLEEGMKNVLLDKSKHIGKTQ